MIHEDERRILESYPEAKIITAKKDTTIGKHYHKVKTEKFILIHGECEIVRNGFSEDMAKCFVYEVIPNTFHEFHIKKDSILLGFNSHPYDPTDDYK